MRRHLLTTAVLCTVLVSPLASASGGGGFGGNNYSSQKVDQQYELGKSYYKGRLADGSRLEYCVRNGDSLKKLSRRTVKPFKKGSASAFIDSLYNCSNPSQKIADVVADNQGDAILYYLNKRYKLRLQNG